MYYVYVFNGPAEAFECTGAFSHAHEAEACLAATRQDWEARRGEGPRPEFPGGIAQETWKEFVDNAVHVQLGRLAEPVRAIASLYKNLGLAAPEQLASK